MALLQRLTNLDLLPVHAMTTLNVTKAEVFIIKKSDCSWLLIFSTLFVVTSVVSPYLCRCEGG